MSGRALRQDAVLIVDDDEDLRATIATMLADAGYPTRQADCGVEALRIARLEPPALVLLDVNLPGMCGYEVYRLLRDDLGDQFPIVFISGERTASLDRVGGLLLGANDYMVKPFAEDELLARVHNLLGRRHAPAARAIAARLTRREFEVLRLLAAGRGPDEIARLLVISPKTVGTHVERIYVKLGVQTRAQAVAVAYRDALLDADGASSSA
jgi:DNA-binding NarL/FixJ family response regulator